MIDICGTGGDKLELFNISTTAMFVLAAGGACVVKHGNRAITSRCGGADVLEELGVKIDLPPADLRRCVETHGLGFVFAPAYHPAFKAIGPVRKALAAQGVPTIFNLLGPLLNPARPPYQLVGVYSPVAPAENMRPMRRCSGAPRLGGYSQGAAWIELSLTDVLEHGDEPRWPSASAPWIPAALGLPPAPSKTCAAATARHNAAILTAIIDGSSAAPSATSCSSTPPRVSSSPASPPTCRRPRAGARADRFRTGVGEAAGGAGIR